MKKSKTVREPIATWWKIDRYAVKIDPVKVVSFSDSYVTYIDKPWTFSDTPIFREIRERRDDIFPTFEEAKLEAIRRTQDQLNFAHNEAQIFKSELGQWESLQKPDVQ